MELWITSERSQRGTARGIALLALLALLAVALVACGGSGSASDQGEAPDGGGAGAADSFVAAYPKAQEAMQAVAGDAVLLAAGTGGLALSDVPANWTFTYYSAGENMLYVVSVEHGTAEAPREFSEAAEGTELADIIDPATIKVGAAEAVVKAREFGSASGEVPKNVLVGGSFAQTPGSEQAGMDVGVWDVTFATGTDLADKQEFTVDMMSGEVAAAKD
jgi:hypothetical protein